MLVIVLITITNLQLLNWHAPKQRFKGVLDTGGLVHRYSSLIDMSNMDLINQYKRTVDLNKITFLYSFVQYIVFSYLLLHQSNRRQQQIESKNNQVY